MCQHVNLSFTTRPVTSISPSPVTALLCSVRVRACVCACTCARTEAVYMWLLTVCVSNIMSVVSSSQKDRRQDLRTYTHTHTFLKCHWCLDLRSQESNHQLLKDLAPLSSSYCGNELCRCCVDSHQSSVWVFLCRMDWMLTHICVHSWRHAGWRRQEGFSHTASAAAALDSTEWLSRYNLAIIRAVLSGQMEWERREEGRKMQTGEKSVGEKSKACLLVPPVCVRAFCWIFNFVSFGLQEKSVCLLDSVTEFSTGFIKFCVSGSVIACCHLSFWSDWWTDPSHKA